MLWQLVEIHKMCKSHISFVLLAFENTYLHFERPFNPKMIFRKKMKHKHSLFLFCIFALIIQKKMTDNTIYIQHVFFIFFFQKIIFYPSKSTTHEKISKNLFFIFLKTFVLFFSRINGKLCSFCRFCVVNVNKKEKIIKGEK